MSIQKTNPIISESDDELAENPVGGLPIRIRNSDIQFQNENREDGEQDGGGEKSPEVNSKPAEMDSTPKDEGNESDDDGFVLL